ncbi:MAG: hypothetical protein IJO89_04225, partial [Clostridia bacterium]|nr:hypothetical protein [Clostridia bacterium]
MKRLVAIIILICLIFTLCSCENNGSTTVIDGTISLADAPIAKEATKFFDTKGAETIELNFDVPESGFIKLRAYDASENDNPDYPTATLSFIDADGKVIADELYADSGFTKKVKVETGKLTARLKFGKGYEKMEKISVMWAFAPDKDEILEVKVDGEPVVARVNDEKEASFKVNITETGLYKVYMNESCLTEGDCAFYVKDKDGVKITSEFYIHGTEWIWRRLFLTPGEYEIVGCKIDAVAECEVKTEEKTPDVQLNDVMDAELPVRVGFVMGETAERTVTFTPNDSGLLVFEAVGSDTDNDGGQGFAVTVTDSTGYSETDEEGVGSTSFELAKFKGKIT